MIKYLIVLAGITVAFSVSAQKDSQNEKLYGQFFREVKNAAEQQMNLWGKSIYGPVLLVDPATREIFANEPDLENKLTHSGGIWTGQFPYDINIANKSVYWLGKEWAMILLPLPIGGKDRIHLMAHELFHVQQPMLGFKLYNPDNHHLDTRDGRIWLRLECEALLKALDAGTMEQAKKHLKDAISFRLQRHLVFPGSDSTENLLELNEGITDYTGLMISGRNKNETHMYFRKKIHAFINNPTFVRSFAYTTTPVYGYFSNIHDPDWLKRIDSATNLTEFFSRIMSIKPVNALISYNIPELKKYNADQIISAEYIRESERMSRIATYRSLFIQEPHLDIPLQEMNISFNPDNLIPLENAGTVYPNLRITDKWGILTVEKGALIHNGWNKVTVGDPKALTDRIITGDGWKLELNEGYIILKENNTGNSKLVKK